MRTETLVKQVEAMDVDQLEDYRKRFFEVFDEAAKRKEDGGAGPNRPAA